MGRQWSLKWRAAAFVVVMACSSCAWAQDPSIDNPTKLVNATPQGDLLLDGYSLMVGNTTNTPSLSFGPTGVNSVVVGPGELAFTPAASGAACISFSFASMNTSGIDAFLSTQEDLDAIVDENGDGYDFSLARPLDRTHYQSAQAGNVTVGVNASSSYMLAMVNRGNETGNVTYSFGALTSSDPGCAGAPAASSTGSILQNLQDSSKPVYFEDDYLLMPGERFSVALFSSISCIAFEMPAKPNASVDTTVIVATAATSLGWLAAQLQGPGSVLPVASGPLCHQDPTVAASSSTANKIALAGANSTNPGFAVSQGDAVISPTESCQVVADNLNPAEIYMIWIYNALESPLSATKLRYTARTNGSCAGLVFPQSGNDILVFTDNLVYEQNVVQNPRNLGTPSAIPIYPPVPAATSQGSKASSKLSSGAIAGIAIGAACGLLAVLALLFYLAIWPHMANARNHKLRKERSAKGLPEATLEDGTAKRSTDGRDDSASNHPQAYTKEEMEKGYVFEQRQAQSSPFATDSDYIGADKLPPSEETTEDLTIPTNSSSGAAVSVDPMTTTDADSGPSHSTFPSSSNSSTARGVQIVTIQPPSGGFRSEYYPQSTEYQTSQRSTSGSENSEEVLLAEMPDRRMMTVSRGREGSVRVSGAPPSSTAGIAGESELIASGSDSSLELPQLWCDWQMDPADIQYETDEHGDPVQLGAGSFGSVFKAKMNKVHDCAVKEFRESHDKEQQTAILREVAIMISCHHPNIVQFLGACYKEKKMLLVMECMVGGDLYSALKLHHNEGNGPLSWYRRGKQIALDIAKGLHYLHWRKMIHFDLKSSNVLLSKAGQAKLTDMGFSNILTSGKTHLSEGGGGWTMAWASPEVLLGQRCSTKADIFSLGVVLYEIVMGEVPRRGDMEPIRVPDLCPQEVEQLIYRCTSPEPHERPTALEIVQVLEKVQLIQRPPLSAASSAAY